MQRYLFFLLVLICTAGVRAQKQEASVYLNNGSIIRGELLDSNSATVRIRTCCGSEFVFQQGEVLRIDREAITSRYTIKSKGYVSHNSMGVLVGSSDNKKEAPFSILFEHGYLFNDYVSAGLLIGYELLEEPVLPLAFVGRGYLPLQRNILVLGISSGYSFSIENPDSEYFETNNGGFLFNTELGLMIPFSENNSFYIAAGFRYNILNYTREDMWLGSVDRKVSYNRLNIRIGLVIY